MDDDLRKLFRDAHRAFPPPELDELVVPARRRVRRPVLRWSALGTGAVMAGLAVAFLLLHRGEERARRELTLAALPTDFLSRPGEDLPDRMPTDFLLEGR
jgi:hypothetical protein